MQDQSAPTGIRTVSVEIFADVICPWCYIGKRRLDDAFAHIGELVLVFAHAQASVTVFIARAKRSRVGKYAHSWACG